MEATAARSEVAAAVRALMGRGVNGKRVTQTQLGQILGMSQGPVSERLAGQKSFSFDELLAIAEFFNVSISSIIVSVDQQRRPSGQEDRLSIWNDDTDHVVSGRRDYDEPLPFPSLQRRRVTDKVAA